MIGLGPLIHCASIVAGSVAGRLAEKRFRPSHQESLSRTSGVCVLFIAIAGAMALMGSIQDGLPGDWSTLAVKSVLDFIIIAVMNSSLGRGCLSLIDSILVFCVGAPMTLPSFLVF